MSLNRQLAVVSVVGLIGASGFVAWSVLSRSDDTIITSGGSQSFNLQIAPAPETIMRARLPSEDAGGAAPASVSPRPIALAEMAPVSRPATPAPPAVRPFLTPRLEKAARSSPVYAALLRAPARLMGSGGPLQSPRGLRAFLADKRAVNGYLDSTLVRFVLNSPAAAKAVLGSSLVVRSFLGTPAMRDPAAVRALLGSRMLVKMLDCPGVQAALADPKVIRSMVANPETAAFIERNPQSIQAIANAAPDLARALNR